MRIPFFRRKPKATEKETEFFLAAMVCIADGLTGIPQCEELVRLAEVQIYKTLVRNPKMRRPTLDEARSLDASSLLH